MPVEKAFTPLPPVRRAPVLVTTADWHDLDANSSTRVLNVRNIEEESLDVLEVGGRPEDDVDVEVVAQYASQRGQQTETQTVDTDAQGDFNFPATSGPIATDSLIWRTVNRSGTDFTDNNNNPYQTYMTYAVRPLTVVEKLRRGIPLDQREQQLANRRFPGEALTLNERENLELPPAVDPAYQPNLEGKRVIEHKTSTGVVDLAEAGTEGAQSITTQNVRRASGLPIDVVYLTDIGINSAEFSETENLTISVIRDETDEILRVPSFGLPGIGTGTGVTSGNAAGTSQPPFLANFHIPFLNKMTVRVFSDTDGQTPNGVEVRVEFARVQRTLVEKALYDLSDQLGGGALRQQREQLFEQIQAKIEAGLPLTIERQQATQPAEAQS